jgi:hypothetical protein
MKRIKQRENNTPNYAPYQLTLPMDIGELIETDESVNTVLKITERLDYNLLTASYDRLPSGREASPNNCFNLSRWGS